MRRALALFILLGGPAVADDDPRRHLRRRPERDGPGVLLARPREPPRRRPPRSSAVIRAVRPDVLLLTGFDHDLRGRALAAFARCCGEGPDGIDYPHRFHAPVNAGRPSGFDLDGDGRLMGWGDAFGWGKFPGHGGMAILSRLPIDAAAARTFRAPALGRPAGRRAAAAAGRRARSPSRGAGGAPLSSRSHWDVPVLLPGGARLHLLASQPDAAALRRARRA